ncbi:SURF1 family protein [Sneathiella limimaris]|uniref:SURF1 family protein n=1 Tax=Sneathiella limimaris TaxID=1964213 RepID=UPI00146DD8B4|nr:SURF1 family protein [Sneathiella limimaris]
MKKFSPGILPTLMTIPLVLILLGLSLWQINRYSWKVDLLDNLEQQLAEQPQQLPSVVDDIEEWNYRRVFLTGEFLHDKEIHLFAHAEKGLKGFQIITPFKRSDADTIVLVNRGWVPEYKKEADDRAEGNITGEIRISGIVRKPWEKSYSFLPESNAESNVWLYGELDAMAAHLNLTVEPVFVELDKMDVPGGFPKGGQTRITVPNNHVEYAITWFGLAVAMLVIYGLYGMRKAKNKTG